MYTHMYIYIMNPSSWFHKPGGSVVKYYLRTVELHDTHMEWMSKRTLLTNIKHFQSFLSIWHEQGQ